jgi:hypothetical protein
MVEQKTEGQPSLGIEVSEVDLLNSFLERTDLPWPPDAHERGLELFGFYPDRENTLFILVAKPIRLTKPGRYLWSKTPESPEILKILNPRHVYGEEVLPNGTSGMHIHKTKAELFYPGGELWLYLFDPETGKRRKLKVYKRTENTVFGVLIPPEIVHAFHNGSSDQSVGYDIISNMPETEAIAKGEIIPFYLDLANFDDN